MLAIIRKIAKRNVRRRTDILVELATVEANIIAGTWARLGG
jgi:hypothetical protein